MTDGGPPRGDRPELPLAFLSPKRRVLCWTLRRLGITMAGKQVGAAEMAG